MYKFMETVGDRLLGLFVPKADAAAADPPCGWQYFRSCHECSYRPCLSYCCWGQGCAGVICY